MKCLPPKLILFLKNSMGGNYTVNNQTVDLDKLSCDNDQLDKFKGGLKVPGDWTELLRLPDAIHHHHWRLRERRHPCRVPVKSHEENVGLTLSRVFSF